MKTPTHLIAAIAIALLSAPAHAGQIVRQPGAAQIPILSGVTLPPGSEIVMLSGSTVQVAALAGPYFLVEIEATAAKAPARP